MADKDEEEWPNHPLERPALGKDGEVNWGSIWLYQIKGGVPAPRPIFTGDVFHGVPVVGDPLAATADIVILQHPCALRTDGNELRPVLVAARLIDFPSVPLADWSGNYDVMPLVVLRSSPPKYQAASFDQIVLVDSAELKLHKRVACMKMDGIGLLLQRWTNMNTRVVVPTRRFAQVTSLQVAEADGIEDWCKQRRRAKVNLDQAAKEATAWLDAKSEETGVRRRLLLEGPLTSKGIIRRMENVAKEQTDRELAARAAAKEQRATEEVDKPAG